MMPGETGHSSMAFHVQKTHPRRRRQIVAAAALAGLCFWGSAQAAQAAEAEPQPVASVTDVEHAATATGANNGEAAQPAAPAEGLLDKAGPETAGEAVGETSGEVAAEDNEESTPEDAAVTALVDGGATDSGPAGDTIAADNADISGEADSSESADATGSTAENGGTIETGGATENGDSTDVSPAGSPVDASRGQDGASGAAPTTGWTVTGTGKRYYDAFGTMLTGSAFVDGSWRYFSPDTGLMITEAWVESDGGARYYAADGSMVTGAYTPGAGMQMFFSLTTGFVLKDAFALNDAGNLTHYDADGQLSRGTVEVDGSEHLFDADSGEVQAGEQVIDGVWQYVNPDGRVFSGAMMRARALGYAQIYLAKNENPWTYLADATDNYGALWCPYGPCIATVWHIFLSAGLPGTLTGDLVPGWPHLAYDYMDKLGQIVKKPVLGAVVYYNWPDEFGGVNRLNLSASHAEFVVEILPDGNFMTAGVTEWGLTLNWRNMDNVVGFGLPGYFLHADLLAEVSVPEPEPEQA